MWLAYFESNVRAGRRGVTSGSPRSCTDARVVDLEASMGVVAIGLRADILEKAVRGLEKLKSKPLNEFGRRIMMLGPYFPLGRWAILSFCRAGDFILAWL